MQYLKEAVYITTRLLEDYLQTPLIEPYPFMDADSTHDLQGEAGRDGLDL